MRPISVQTDRPRRTCSDSSRAGTHLHWGNATATRARMAKPRWRIGNCRAHHVMLDRLRCRSCGGRQCGWRPSARPARRGGASCVHCIDATQNVAVRDSESLVVVLQAPEPAAARTLFASLVQSAIARTQYLKARAACIAPGTHVPQSYCEKCRDFKSTLQRRSLVQLPQVLAFNCGTDKALALLSIPHVSPCRRPTGCFSPARRPQCPHQQPNVRNLLPRNS